MAGKGPPPVPTAILQLRGSNRVSERRKRGEPEPLRPPSPPRELHPASKAIWDDLFAILCETGVLGVADGYELARLSDLYAALAMAAEKHDVETMIKLSAPIARIAERYGLTPSDRVRIQSIPKTGSDERDNARKAAKFFGGSA